MSTKDQERSMGLKSTAGNKHILGLPRLLLKTQRFKDINEEGSTSKITKERELLIIGCKCRAFEVEEGEAGSSASTITVKLPMQCLIMSSGLYLGLRGLGLVIRGN